MTPPRTRPTGNLPAMPSRLPLWHPQGTVAQQDLIWEAMGRCDFPWDWLRVGLTTDTGRERIPVEWAGGRVKGHGAELTNLAGERATIVKADADCPAALAWRSGRVTLDWSLARTSALAMQRMTGGWEGPDRTLLLAAAHMVDWFWLSEDQRDGVHAVISPADWQLPDAFLAAFTDLPTRIPRRAASAVRAVMLGAPDQKPAEYVASRRVWHHPACPVLPLIRRPEQAGYLPPPRLRPCRVCRPDQPSRVLFGCVVHAMGRRPVSRVDCG